MISGLKSPFAMAAVTPSSFARQACRCAWVASSSFFSSGSVMPCSIAFCNSLAFALLVAMASRCMLVGWLWMLASTLSGACWKASSTCRRFCTVRSIDWSASKARCMASSCRVLRLSRAYDNPQKLTPITTAPDNQNRQRTMTKRRVIRRLFSMNAFNGLQINHHSVRVYPNTDTRVGHSDSPVCAGKMSMHTPWDNRPP